MRIFTNKWSVLPVAALLCIAGLAHAESNSDPDKQKDAVSAELSKVTITWQDPDSYRDIKPSNEMRKKFRNRVFDALNEYFNQLAEDLPEAQSLAITVTDLDLAGQVWPTMRGGAGDIRIIDSLYIPRIEFSYELKDGVQVIKSAQVDLKDMSFMNRVGRVRSSDPLRYEKEMIKRWFDSEFDDSIVKN